MRGTPLQPLRRLFVAFLTAMALCWLFRCLPGLSVLALLILTECALQVLQTIACISLNYSPGLARGHHPVFAQILFM